VIRVLIVDDDEASSMLANRLRLRSFSVETRTMAASAIELLRTVPFDALVADLNLQRMSGVELCREALALHPELPVILVTAFGSMASAIDAIRVGAYDFIPKPFEIDQLVLAIQRGVTLARLKTEVKRLQQIERTYSPKGLLGKSSKMARLFELIAMASRSEAPVLIMGETGTGKELVARAIHADSARGDNRFVAVNCAALPEHLLESELFGHVKGAFTGANASKTGLFVAAHRGTMFLDEIGELPLAMQSKLLRVLQERTVRPVGSTSESSFDTRIIAATNRDLLRAIEEGQFREDLYFRLDVLEIHLPPLRARGSDILLLAQHFLAQFAERDAKAVVGLSAEAAERLLAYPWPGNVRELQNCLERAVAVAGWNVITAADLPERIRNYQTRDLALGGDASSFVTLAQLEERYAYRVLVELGGNKSAAARVLGIQRKTLTRIIERSSPAVRKRPD
jgi:two-component system response regulator HydG